MRKFIYIFIFISVTFACEKATIVPRTKNIDFNLGESFDICLNDTLYNENEDITVCFNEITEMDCNSYFDCYGDKVMHFIFNDESDMDHDIYFYNDTTLDNTKFISGYSIFLNKIINDSLAQLIIDKENQNNYVYGKVIDLTGLDGCGLMILLDNGERLEPVEIVPDFTLIEGQKVRLKYTVLNNIGSYCMAGTVVRIDEIEEISCNKTLSISTIQIDTMPNDGFELDTAFINGSCLDIKVKYGGGCNEHFFYLVFSNTNPYINSLCKSGNCISEEPILFLYHDGNDDMCEAYLSETVSFDIGFLKNIYLPDSTIQLISIPEGHITKLEYP